jgi:hypothetical protein
VAAGLLAATIRAAAIGCVDNGGRESQEALVDRPEHPRRPWATQGGVHPRRPRPHAPTTPSWLPDRTSSTTCAASTLTSVSPPDSSPPAQPVRSTGDLLPVHLQARHLRRRLPPPRQPDRPLRPQPARLPPRRDVALNRRRRHQTPRTTSQRASPLRSSAGPRAPPGQKPGGPVVRRLPHRRLRRPRHPPRRPPPGAALRPHHHASPKPTGD